MSVIIKHVIEYQTKTKNGVLNGKFEFHDFYGALHYRNQSEHEKRFKSMRNLYEKAKKKLEKNKNCIIIGEYDEEMECD